MSREVEERVVQMSFENGQFEKAAKQSLETIEQIKKNTDFKPAAKAIENSGMVEAIKNIEHSMTSFGGILKRKIFDQLANQVISSARKMFREIEIEPIQQGFSEYELKMGSVQTIMASTGESLEKVNGYLDELNTYADRTIYSFSDMTNNIGKFTNAGVSLESAVAAIQGISNEAALSGANANEASRAMYNFAQALSSGVVRLIDWKSIENANMATVEFKEELIKTAEELGTIKKQSDGTYKATTANTKKTFDATKGFNDALQDQWLTSDVLITTLSKYSDETTDLGKRAYAAAQDVKTFTQLIDTLKEASGSGWAQTWEIIFGDFNEAKELWTGVNNVISELIDRQSKSRNAMLQQWKDLGGRTELIKALSDAFEVLKGFVTAAMEGFREFFPALTGEKLFAWTKKFHEVVERIKNSIPFIYEYGENIEGSGDKIYKTTREHFKYTGILEKVYRIFNGLGAAGSILIKVISTLGKAFFSLVKMALPFGSGFLEFFASIGDKIAEVRDTLEGKDFFGSWTQKIQTALTPLGPKLEVLREKFAGFFQSIKTWYEDSGLEQKVASGFQKLFDDFTAAVPVVLSSIVDFISGIVDFVQTNEVIQSIVDKIKGLISSIVEAAPELYNKVVDFAKGLLGLTEGSKSLGERFNELATSIKNFVKELLGYDENGESVLSRLVNDLFPSFAKAAENGEDAVVNPITSIIDKATNLVADVKEAIANIGQTIADSFDWIIEKWEEYNISDKLSKLFSLWMGAKFFGLMGSFTKINTALAQGLGGFSSIFQAITESIKTTTSDASGVFGSLKNVFATFWENVTGMNKSWAEVFRKKDSPATAMLKAAAAIGILVASVYVLTKIDSDQFIAAAEKLGILAAGLLIFTGIFNKLSKGFEIKDVGAQLMKMGLGIILLIGAMALISRMDDNSIVKGLYGLAFILIELAAFYNLTKGSGFSKDAGPKFISLALSLILMTVTLKQLGKMDLASLTKSIIALGFILFELAAFVKFAKLGKGEQLPGFIGLAFTLLSVVKIMNKLAKMKLEDLAKSLIALGVILAELAIFTRLANTNFNFSVGIGFLGLAISLIAIVQVMKQLAKMKDEDISKSLGIVTVMLLEMAVISRLMGRGVKIGRALGMLVALAGSLMLFIAALYLLKDYSASKMLGISVSFAAIMGSLAAVLYVIGKIPVAAMVKGITTLGIIAAVVLAIGWALSAIDEWTNGGLSNALDSAGAMLYTVGKSIGEFFAGINDGVNYEPTDELKKYLADEHKLNLLDQMQEYVQAIVDAVTILKDLKPDDLTTAERAMGLLKTLKDSLPTYGGMDQAIHGEIAWGAYSVEEMTGLADGITALVEGLKTAGLADDSAITLVSNFRQFMDTLVWAIPKEGGFSTVKNGSFASGMAQLATNLPKLAKGLVEFQTNIAEGGGLNTDLVTQAGIAAGALAALQGDIPKENPVLGFIIGSSAYGMKLFSLNLPNLGKGLSEFSKDASDLSIISVAKAYIAAKMIQSFTSSLPEKNLLSFFTDMDVSHFAGELPYLGTQLAGFSTNASGLGLFSVAKAIVAGKMLAAFTTSLPEKSMLAFFTDQSVAHFAGDLPYLGTQLSSFATNVSDLDSTAVEKAVNAASIIAGFAVTLPEKSLLDYLFDKSVADFAKDLPTLGTNITSFANSVAGANINLFSVWKAATAGKMVAALASVDLGKRTFGDIVAQWATGKTNFEHFAEGMGQFGSGLSQMYTAASQVEDWSVVENAVTNLAEIAKMVKDLSEGAWTNFQFTGEAFNTWDQNGLKEFLTNITNFGTVPYETGVSFATEVSRGMTESLALLSPTVEANWLNVGTTLINAASKTGNAMYQMGIVIGNNFISGLRFPDYYAAGVSAGSGFVNGVLSKTAAAYNVGASLGRSSLSGTRSAINAHSPSKEFAKLGEYSGKGFTLGLESYIMDARDSGRAIGEATLIGARTTLGYLNSIINSEMNLQPVVRPVVDGSGIQSWVAQNGNLLSGANYPIYGFSGRLTPSYAGVGPRMSSEMLYKTNQNVVAAVQELGSRVDALGDRIASMQMVTDTGTMAGEMREHIDNELGVIALRKGRRN